MWCEYWDWADPTGNISYYDWWTNNTSQTVSYSADDTGGSTIKKVELQWKTATDSPTFSSWSSWSTKKTDDNINNNSFSSSYSYTWNNRTAYKFRIIITDVAWNITTIDWSDTTKIDTDIPSASDITFTPTSWTNMLATNNKNFKATVSINQWSPIVRVEWYFEDYDKNNCGNWLATKDSVNWWTLSVDHSIEEVKSNCDWNSAIWGRIYSFKITYIKDEAWNETSDINWIKIANYNVYSNHNNITTKVFDNNDKSNLEDSNNIADWTPYDYKATIQDIYWNAIIPSSWINRTIDFNFDVTNTTDLDQYRKTWDAIYLALPTKNNSTDYTNKLWTNNSFNNQAPDSILDWRYDFKFKVYTPTNQETTAIWWFIINSVSFDVNSDLWNPSNIAIWNNSVNFNFKPLYKTTFNWDQANYWFIEWVIQNWNIDITNNNSWKSTSNKKLYLEFWKWNRVTSNEVDMYTLSPDEQVIEGHQTYVSDLEDLIASYPSNVALNTKIIQNPGQTLTNLQEYYLSTHFAYTIDWHNVVYNSSVLGRDNYFDGPPSIWNATQVWIKVLWITYSKKQKDIITNQEQNDIHILWTINKSKLKENIRKNIYKIISNINWNQGWSSNDIDNFGWTTWNSSNKGKRLYDNKVLYFDLSWVSEKVIVTNWWTVSWQKTLIVKWWDLYIKWDIKYNSNSDILGIAVLKDTNWKWGNIYIAPNVKYIWAQIYADKAILSAIDGYDGSANDNEISSSEVLPVNTSQSTLKDQLYIKWQVFSENTIWGSRENPPICPYYDKASCDLDKAQKYDLNYLRRYYIYDSNHNWIIDNLDVAANTGANYRWTFDTSVYPYARYPVVIDYNPIVQITPPPLFDN